MTTLRRWGLPGILVLFISIQAIPYGRHHTNPPVQQEPAWDSPQTRELVVHACYDCHSNQTEWPWYSNIAPVSWMIQHDVNAGRAKLNFSEWNQLQREPDEASETVLENEMPPIYYALFRSRARLSSDERQALVQGLTATLTQDRPHSEVFKQH